MVQRREGEGHRLEVVQLAGAVDPVVRSFVRGPYWIPKLKSSPVAGSQVGYADMCCPLQLAVEVVLADRVEAVGVEPPGLAALPQGEQVAGW